MTTDKHFKARVRERMAARGVSYTEALRQLRAERPVRLVGSTSAGYVPAPSTDPFDALVRALETVGRPDADWLAHWRAATPGIDPAHAAWAASKDVGAMLTYLRRVVSPEYANHALALVNSVARGYVILGGGRPAARVPLPELGGTVTTRPWIACDWFGDAANTRLAVAALHRIYSASLPPLAGAIASWPLTAPGGRLAPETEE